MEQIILRQVLPEVFVNEAKRDSQVWQTELVLRKGEVCLVEAASGTGKSSLCSYIYGYRSDYEGTIFFDQEDIKNFSVARWSELRRTSLSTVFQELRLFPELTARENIGLKLSLVPRFKEDKWVSGCFERLGIADRLDTKVSKLSFGQQQRVAFVRALCQPFDFLLLDEPVSHLDDINAQIVAAMLAEVVATEECGVILTSIGKHPDMKYDKILKL